MSEQQPAWMAQYNWMQQQREKRKQNKQQEIQQQIQDAQAEAKPSTAKRVLHAVRNEDRKRRVLGGGFY